MNTTKSLLLTIAILLCSLSASAHNCNVNGIYYNLDNTNLTATVTYKGSWYDSYSNEYSGEVVIPESFSYIGTTYSVTSIGEYAFEGCSGLTSISIPNSVTSIGEYAFNGCSSLSSVRIEDGKTTLSLGYHTYGYPSTGKGLFYNCPIETLYLGRNLEYRTGYTFGYSPFAYNKSIKQVEIGNLVTSIEDNAFYCSGLTSISIPNSVTSIGDYAFKGCSGLTSISIPNSVTSIDYKTFDGCSGLTSISIPNSVTSIGKCAFKGCSGLTSISIPNSVTSIGDCAFGDCSSLSSVRIEDGETSLSLGYESYGYSSSAGEGLFYDCPIETLYLGRNLEYDSERSYGYSPFAYNKSIKQVEIGNLVTSIGECAFEGCSGLTSSITIPNSVTSIGYHAFYNYNPKKVIWLTNTPPSGYTNLKGAINYAANDQYSGLNQVKIYPYLSSMFEAGGVKYVPVSPSDRTCDAIDCVYGDAAERIEVKETVSFKGVEMKVKEIMPYTFYNNNAIKEVSVSHLGSIGEQAFYDCDSIQDITISNHGYIGSQAFYDCDGIQNINLNNRGSVEAQVFYDCTALKTVMLGDSIVSLGNMVFYQCKSLEEIIIPDSLIAMGSYCFTGCSALTNVELGSRVATIGNYAFSNCSSLPEITLPQSVTKIGDYVFEGCSKLADVMIEDRTTAMTLGSNGSSPLFADCPLDSVYIGGKITYSTASSKGYSPFYRNTSLRTVVITDQEEQIYTNEFYGCTALKNVSIGNGVKSIGNYAFSGCSALDGFSFGSNMESIGDEAFSDCNNLTSLSSYAITPPVCGTQALDDINKWNCVLRVPTGYAAAYQAAEQWKEFFFVEGVMAVKKYALTFVVDGEVYHVDSLVHKETIILPETPVKEGYKFSGWNDVPETMPAQDVTITGTFSINKYLLKFIVEDNVIASDSIEYGAAIITPEVPEKEGHTFNGWSDVPETMPAQDVTITGTFSINKYLLKFVVEDNVIASDSIEYGAAIITPEAPEKEGHTFSGWNDVPETMPAQDVTITGTYSVNLYQLIYIVDGEEYAKVDVAYGDAITLIDAPVKEGYIFSGWSEVPEIMPAHDVEVTGSFTVDDIEKIVVENPVDVYDLSGGKVKSQVAPEDALRDLPSGLYIVNGKKIMVK